ncbi:PREDICTED: uncharacterized protein LOC108551475 isoform X1 [Eufriesea mexicana]|uniref:uncharacterized protein LOC108551475 isoform X1 n=2 Tax=Eufriesea mexicana TaxID=516756 RepID=UPI00083C068B|nr:PREDICTED: uncharacterized protein LOC108551475 isoform X1 [Eufriesea mexicana]
MQCGRKLASGFNDTRSTLKSSWPTSVERFLTLIRVVDIAPLKIQLGNWIYRGTMTHKKHISDVQPATVDEHFQLILEDRDVIDSEFSKVTSADLPEWFDEYLFKKGQEYYMGNLLGFGVAHITGLTAIMSVPDILEVLLYTKRSSTINLAYKRFTETLLLMYALFYSDMLDPNSKWFKALNVIRWRHANVSKRRVEQGLHGIYQKDMAITQFGFIGFIFICPERVGLVYGTREEKEGFNHFWQVTGHLLGISDRINICRKTVSETVELCRRIRKEILAKHLEEPRQEFLDLMSNITNGLWYVDFSINEDAFMHFTYDITGLKYKKPLGWYAYLNLKQREAMLYICNYAYIGWVIRMIYNCMLGLSYWLVENYPIVSYLAFGRKQAQLSLYPKI